MTKCAAVQLESLTSRGKYPAFETASRYGSIGGALAGAGIAGLWSWLYYRKKRKQSVKSRILKSLGWAALAGLGGAAAGAYVGRMYSRHRAYSDVARQLKEKSDEHPEWKRPGRVFYVDCADNRFMPKEDGLLKKIVDKTTDGGLPTGHAMLGAIDEQSGKLYLTEINTKDESSTSAEGKAIKDLAIERLKNGIGDPEKNYDLGVRGHEMMRRAKGGAPLKFDHEGIDVKGKTDKEIADIIAAVSSKRGFGDRVVIHEGDKTDNIYVPLAFMQESYDNTLRENGGGYSAMPGGYNCGTAAREAYDMVQKSQWSHFRDMLWGGGTTQNAPMSKKTWSNK